MRHITVSSFPNREIRVTITRETVTGRNDYEFQETSIETEKTPSALTCHSLKTLKGQSEGDREKGDGGGAASGYGKLGKGGKFSTYGRRQILRAGGALEQVASYQDVLFLTVTLPGSTQQSFQAIAEWSGFAVQRLKAWLCYRVKDNLSMYVWEWQKRGALHLHYVLHCPDRRVGEYVCTNLRAEWCRILDSISLLSGVDLYKRNQGFSWSSDKDLVRVDAQWCEKSVAAYLSKYVSKGNGSMKGVRGWRFAPSRWYGVSRPLLALLREMSKKTVLTSLSNPVGYEFYEEAFHLLQSYGIKCYEYKHQVGDGKTIVAYVNQNEQESIWESIMNKTELTPDPSMKVEEKLKRQILNGALILSKHQTWFETWRQFSGDYLEGIMVKLRTSQPITDLDYQYVLDQLAYTYRYTERVRSRLPGSANLWYSRTKELLEEARAMKIGWVGCLKM